MGSPSWKSFKQILVLWLTTIIVGGILPILSSARGINRNQPHSHRGKLHPYQPGPFQNLQLSNADETKLAQGEAVMKQTMPTATDESGSAICVQDIHAPYDAVWYQILDLDHYCDKISKLKECKNYFVQKNTHDGTYRIKTKQVLGVLPGYAYESYYDHTYDPHKSSMVWSLDYDKTSDFDDVAGHWHVESRNPNLTRVYYACDIQMKGHVPKPVLNYISKAALKQATSWVKKESEAHPDNVIPKEYGGSSHHHHPKHHVQDGHHEQPSTEEDLNHMPKRPCFWRFWGQKQKQ